MIFLVSYIFMKCFFVSYLSASFIIVQIHQRLGFVWVFATPASVSGVYEISRKCNAKIDVVTAS